MLERLPYYKLLTEQDKMPMVRYMRMTEDNGNPYGIDPEKIVLGGQGTGHTFPWDITLDDESKLYLPKFIDQSNPQIPIPYVVPVYMGNFDGTDMTYALCWIVTEFLWLIHLLVL